MTLDKSLHLSGPQSLGLHREITEPWMLLISQDTDRLYELL